MNAEFGTAYFDFDLRMKKKVIFIIQNIHFQ